MDAGGVIKACLFCVETFSNDYRTNMTKKYSTQHFWRWESRSTRSRLYLENLAVLAKKRRITAANRIEGSQILA